MMISRRRFLQTAAATAAGYAARPAGSADESIGFPVIDTHIHLFDPSRPQGVPWPSPKQAEMYHTSLPKQLREVSAPFGIRGAIEIECSPWLEDNQWVLDVAAEDSLIVGTVGDLEPGKPEFGGELARFRRNPLFRGIRYGNIWGRDLGARVKEPKFVDDLKRLADAGLVLDTANQTVGLLEAAVRVGDQVPQLRVIVDHLPALARPRKPEERRRYDAAIAELAGRPQVYVKLSAILQRRDGRVGADLESYRPHLDALFGHFGPDRVMFGSDWPNCLAVGSYAEVFTMARSYIATRGRDAAEKFFWKNSIAAYGWKRRS